MQQTNVEDLMGLNADIELVFSDCSVAVNSANISLFSPVLRGAVEATAGTVGSAPCSNVSSSSSAAVVAFDSSKPKIPIEDVSKEEWIEVAEYWYPVVPSPKIAGWEQAELLLRLATQYDIQLVLHKVDEWLNRNYSALKPPPAPGAPEAAASAPTNSVWKWMHLADKSGLTICLPNIAKRAVEVDRAGSSKTDNLLGLSSGALMHMVAAMAATTSFGKAGIGRCDRCRSDRYFRCASCGYQG